MCDPGTAMIVGSTALQATGALAQGQQMKSYNNYRADQANADADYERGMGVVRAGKVRKAGRYQQGAVTAGYAGAGVDVNSGTPAAVGERLQRDISEDAVTQLLTGQRRGAQLDAQAAGDRAAGKNAVTNSLLSATSSVFSGGERWITSQRAKRRAQASGIDASYDPRDYE